VRDGASATELLASITVKGVKKRAGHKLGGGGWGGGVGGGGGGGPTQCKLGTEEGENSALI